MTGGASGIGRALSAALVRRGDHVVLADIDADAATSVAERLSGQGPGRASVVRVDVRDAAGVAAVVSETVQRHGRLDLMVNNVGIGIGGDVEELAVAHWDRVIDVNLRGVVHGVQAAYPMMVRQRDGHIEVWFGIIERQAIHRGSFASVADLNRRIRTFTAGWNDRCHPFVWTKTAEQVPAKTNRQKTSDAPH